MEKKWWKEAVGYQIYPRSFCDSNNDGIGDLKGIIKKLDYLNNLGINMIWICPFYKSPMDDNGYDVSDYYDIDKIFGNLDDMKELIKKAHEKDIKIVADLVLNHTSDEHPWFIEAKKSKENKYRDYYIWAEGKEGKEPTNWASFFGGSAWRKNEDTNDYFMKIFSDKMPDLNWENKELRQDMYKMANWWLELGIDGFRVDAVAHLVRAPFEDSNIKEHNGYAPDWSKFSNLPKLHDHLKEFRKETFSKYDAFAVGEVGGGANLDDILKYSKKENKELDMVFLFDHNHCRKEDGTPDVLSLKRELSKTQTGLYGKAWNPLYWLNHDHPRVLSHYGNETKYRNESAKMLSTLLYFMWGTPFLYNGEEIGMSNYPFTKIEEFTDVAIHNNYNIEVVNGNRKEEEYIKSVASGTRDNARTPMQWTSEENAGFSKKTPWMKVNPNYKEVNVETQLKDENSILNYYKKVIEYRRKSDYKDLIVYGSYKLLDTNNDTVYSYLREYNDKKILVVVNMLEKTGKVNFDYKIKKTLLSNYNKEINSLNNLELKPYECFVVEI